MIIPWSRDEVIGRDHPRSRRSPSRGSPTCIDCEVALELGQVRERRFGRPAQRQERCVRGHHAVGVRRWRRVGLRARDPDSLRSPDPQMSCRCSMGSRSGSFRSHRPRRLGIAALGDVGGRKAPVAIPGFFEPVMDLRRTVSGWLIAQLLGPHCSSGTNSAGISASNMLPPQLGTMRMPAYS